MIGGQDHDVVVSEQTGTVRRRRRPGGEGLNANHEARLLGLVAARVGLGVPRVLEVFSEDEMEMERLPGTPLLHELPALTYDERWTLAEQLGCFVAEMAAIPLPWVEHLVPVERPDLEEHRAEAADMLRRTVRSELPAARRAAIERFLARPCPPAPERLHLAHQDLGAEHVFVQGRPRVATGVIDFSDAAIGDPALDLGLVLRDLGAGAFERALSSFAAADGDLEELVPRALFHARVRALEDLAFGLEHDAAAYRDNALRAIGELFADVR